MPSIRVRLYGAQKESFLYGLSFNPRLTEAEGQQNWLRNDLANCGQGIEEISKETQPKPMRHPGEVRSTVTTSSGGRYVWYLPTPWSLAILLVKSSTKFQESTSNQASAPAWGRRPQGPSLSPKRPFQRMGVQGSIGKRNSRTHSEIQRWFELSGKLWE